MELLEPEATSSAQSPAVPEHSEPATPLFRSSPATKKPRTRYYCQLSPSLVLFPYVDLPPEERATLQLPLLLYVYVFWRGEAEHLEIQS